MGLHTRQAAAMLLVLLTSYLAVRASPGGAGVSEWWVASGIGACAMVTSPRRHAPWLFLGVAGLTWAGNVLGGRAPDTGPWLGLGNAVESYVIAVLLTHNWSRSPRLHSWPDLRRYFLVVALGSAAPALMAVVLSISLLDRSVCVVAIWVFINHFGCNLVLMLLVTSRPPTPRLAEDRGGGAISPFLLGGDAITYAPSNSHSVAFLLTPVAVWAASRFPSRLGRAGADRPGWTDHRVRPAGRRPVRGALRVDATPRVGAGRHAELHGDQRADRARVRDRACAGARAGPGHGRPAARGRGRDLGGAGA